MRRRLRITVLVGIAFVGGMFTHSKIYASFTRPVLEADNMAVATPRSVRYGMASWYSESDLGINEHTANNEVFNDLGMTCAMWDVPFNKWVRVTNMDNGKNVLVRVNDRGPHKRFVRQGRVIDLTKGAFTKIASPHKGLINVQLEFLD